MKRIIFGNENAEKDPLVLKCYVNHGEDGVQIVTGRWGTGKTAYLFDRNRELIKKLTEINPDLKRIWYLDEDQLNTDQLIDSFIELNERKFQRYLKSIWIAEIYRRACIILNALKSTYKNTNGNHWVEISSVAKSEAVGKTVWKQIPNALRILKSIDDKQEAAVVGIQNEFSDIFTDRLKKSVQRCLKDIAEDEVRPTIAIEPIETPLSDIEESSLAQEVISALLNVFQSEFQLGEDQLLEVILSIPWHRFSNDKINLPQKISQYVMYMQWDKDSLREFINKRIEWEFKRVRRTYNLKGKDAWSILFNDNVYNDYCVPNINENSFEYTLRHTHYRPREVQRIARMSVEVCARKANRSVDDVLKGISGLKVDGNHIKEAVYKYSRKATDDLISESVRRFSKLKEVFNCIRGLPVPFSCDDLIERLPKDVTPTQALSMLWESGILGIEITCIKQEYERDFCKLLPTEAYKRNQNYQTKELNRWYFFHYNCDGEITELIGQYKANRKLKIQCIVHPKIYESIGAHVSTNWPYGI